MTTLKNNVGKFSIRLIIFVISFYVGYELGIKDTVEKQPSTPATHAISGMTYAIIEGKVVNLTKDSLEVNIWRDGRAVITHKTMATW